MSTRKKLIVFITVAGYDDKFAVLAESRENGFIAVEGSQLILANLADKYNKFINKDALYHLYKGDYKVKCYDCFKFSHLGKYMEPTVDQSYIMRCQGYHHETGSPGFLPSEVLAAGVPEWKILLYSRDDGLLYIRPVMLQAC